MMKFLAAAGFIILSATAAQAGFIAVPEIDGTSGLAAIAAVGAIVAMVWERRRN